MSESNEPQLIRKRSDFARRAGVMMPQVGSATCCCCCCLHWVGAAIGGAVGMNHAWKSFERDSPGAASGAIVLDADMAERKAAIGEAVILVRVETSPEDIHGMHAAKGILTARGGMTSHAAVVARGMGRPCVPDCQCAACARRYQSKLPRRRKRRAAPCRGQPRQRVTSCRRAR